MAEMNPMEDVIRVPEARYAYYRRCQVFRKNGEQCKAPAEKGAFICHAHAGQQAIALRRERERQAVLAEAVAEIRRKGRPEFEMADLFMDFESIQVTLAVIARALMNDRIDCKTAGRLMVDLQTVSKLLRMNNKKTRNLPVLNAGYTGRKNRTAAERTKVVAKRPDKAASIGNEKIVTIRSAERAQNPFRALWQHGSKAILLTG